MLTSKKCLFSALFSAALAFSGSSVFADCENHLSHGFAKATAKLLRENIIKLEDLRIVVDSERPISPLQFRTPGSRENSFHIQVFEPLKSTNALQTFVANEPASVNDLQFFEHEGHLFVLARTESNIVFAFEAGSGSGPLARLPVGGRINLLKSADQVYLVHSESSSFSAYALFSKGPG